MEEIVVPRSCVFASLLVVPELFRGAAQRITGVVQKHFGSVLELRVGAVRERDWQRGESYKRTEMRNGRGESDTRMGESLSPD